MNLKRVINRGLYLTVIIFITINLIVLLGRFVSIKALEHSNEKKINKVFSKLEFVDSKVNYEILLLEPLLKLKNLTPKQKARIYLTLTVHNYLNSNMEEYLKTISYAIFYNKLVGNKEDVVYLYSTLARYYLEIGADKSANETILQARSIKTFYSCQELRPRMLSLLVYGRYLIDQNDFESAIKAAEQIIKDSDICDGDEDFKRHFKRSGLVLKAFVLLQSGKIDEAYKISCNVLNEYENEGEQYTEHTAYDFIIPIYRIKTEWAIRSKRYQEAIDFNKTYGSLCKKYNFNMQKSLLSKELMFVLPTSMVREREEIFRELAQDADNLAQIFLDNYTSLTSNRLNSIIENLQFETQMEENHNKIFTSILFVLFMFWILIFIMCIIYSETQIDGLTKLRNRRALNTRLGRLASSGRKYSAIMLDIDNFKNLNDTYGHDFGDEVLKAISAILIKKESNNIKSYRYGGEEMVLLLEHFDLDEAINISEEIRRSVENLRWRQNIIVTASFGLGTETTDSVKEADENMYVAKKNGKNKTAYKKDGKQFLSDRK